MRSRRPCVSEQMSPIAPIAVEYSWETLDEIREHSLASAESSGILFGERREGTVRILAWRQFGLSVTSRKALDLFLEEAKSDPALFGLHALGWFISRTDGGVRLAAADLDIYNRYFPWSWQVTLVLSPQADGTAQAGFFIRDPDGAVDPEQASRRFVIEPEPVTNTPGPLAVRPAVEKPERTPKIDPRLWVWAAPGLLALIVAAVIVNSVSAPPPPPSLAFRVSEKAGIALIAWDKSSAVVRSASRGSLHVRDGASDIELPLDARQLRDGSLSYPRKTNDLQVSLRIVPSRGAAVEES